MIKVAALFVDPRGHYPRLPGVDCWDAERDARLYKGPHPVVAHPPCNLWVNFAYLNYKRWGGEHNKPGNDGGCFAAALAALVAFGGVLEHPAGSRAWNKYGLKRPEGIGWVDAGGGFWVCEVWQSAYGHGARKRTWLAYFSPARIAPFELSWKREAGHFQIGKFDRIKPTLYGRKASESPLSFAERLVDLARWSKG